MFQQPTYAFFKKWAALIIVFKGKCVESSGILWQRRVNSTYMWKAKSSLNFNKLEKVEKNKTYSAVVLLLFLDDLFEYIQRLYFELLTVLWIGFLGLNYENS